MADKVDLKTGGVPLIVVQVLLPIILSVFAGYGTVKYAMGETTQQINELTRRAQSNKDDIERVRLQCVSREELRIFIEESRQDLAEIKSDLRALRYEQHK